MHGPSGEGSAVMHMGGWDPMHPELGVYGVPLERGREGGRERHAFWEGKGTKSRMHPRNLGLKLRDLLWAKGRAQEGELGCELQTGKRYG
jgi:hypothetical protein